MSSTTVLEEQQLMFTVIVSKLRTSHLARIKNTPNRNVNSCKLTRSIPSALQSNSAFLTVQQPPARTPTMPVLCNASPSSAAVTSRPKDALLGKTSNLLKIIADLCRSCVFITLLFQHFSTTIKE